MFGMLHFYSKIGDSDRHYCYSLEGLNYIYNQIYHNQDSNFWQKVALYFSAKTNFSTVYFSSVSNMKQMFVQRAEILKIVLQNQNCTLNYSFPVRQPKQHRIRLGIIKEHFKENTETYASIPVFEYLDHDQFEIFLYTLENANTPIEKYSQSCADHFILLPQVLHEQAQTIRNDNLDILFFATNLTASQNKATTFLALHQLARVQVASICSPVTSGMKTIDYYIAGNLTAPIEELQSQYTEKLLNIEGSSLCFHFPVSNDSSQKKKRLRRHWQTSENTIVYISGSNYHKIIPEVRYTWAKIIAKTKNSILVLFPFNPVNPTTQLKLTYYFKLLYY